MLNSKVLLSILFIISIIFITIDMTKSTFKCEKKQTEYKYVPRTFKEEQESPVPIDDIFGSMFNNPSPWVGSFVEPDANKKIN
tara:strand:+ start:360 stop:608 length:249 start_codon:yes stop_codon:yes gene_type:complete